MGDPLYGVLDRVSKIVHGINAPFITRIVMGHVRHTVNDRVAHVDVGACHIDLCPQCLLTVRKLAGAHALKEIEVFLNAPLAVGVIFAGFCQGAAILAHLFRGQVGDIGLALFDELDCDIVHLLEIVRSKEKPVLKIGAQPLDVLLDGLDELNLFLGGVGIVKAKIELSAILLCHAVVEKNALGMSDMKIAIGLGRKACVYCIVHAVPQVLVDLLLNKMAAYLFFFRCGSVHSCSIFTHAVDIILQFIKFSLILDHHNFTGGTDSRNRCFYIMR